MRPAGVVRAVAALSAGFVLGATVALAFQDQGRPRGPAQTADRRAVEEAAVPQVPEPPETYLAWTPGGLPPRFGPKVGALPGVVRAVVVRSGTAWLTRSVSEGDDVVDEPPEGLAIPLEVAAVPPARYGAFLPPADGGVVVALERGEGILGETSARLRGLGPGAALEFGDRRVRVAAVLPDELVGAHELVVSRRVGTALGIELDRYALLQLARPVPSRFLTARIRRLLPPETPLRVRAPGETPYFRHGDAVLAPVRLKELFGEFAARPIPGGYLDIDPAWVRERIVTEAVPIVGTVRCNRGILPMLRGALGELERMGLAGLVDPGQYAGCYSPRFLNRQPRSGISHHAWGVAIDINAGVNRYGHPPRQDPRLVEVFERWGFIWGGRFLIPDGMHFEFLRFPKASTAAG